MAKTQNQNCLTGFLKEEWHSRVFAILFCFILFSVKIISNNANTVSRKMANTWTLQGKYKPCFELPKNSMQRLHKAQQKN